MFVRKLLSGVLHVSTSYGVRCIQLSLRERFHFLWIFRHFHTLPEQVLNSRESQRLDELCSQSRVFHLSLDSQGCACDAVIGTVERLPSRIPASRESAKVLPMPVRRPNRAFAE